MAAGARGAGWMGRKSLGSCIHAQHPADLTLPLPASQLPLGTGAGSEGRGGWSSRETEAEISRGELVPELLLGPHRPFSQVHPAGSHLCTPASACLSHSLLCCLCFSSPCLSVCSLPYSRSVSVHLSASLSPSLPPSPRLPLSFPPLPPTSHAGNL